MEWRRPRRTPPRSAPAESGACERLWFRGPLRPHGGMRATHGADMPSNLVEREMNNAQETTVRPRSQRARTASSARALSFSHDTAFQLALRRRVTEHFWATGRRQRDCWQMYVKTTILLMGFAGAYVSLVFLARTWIEGVPPGHLARPVCGRDRLQHPARRRASGLLEPPVGQPAHGADAGADRRQLLPVALEARRVPSHVRQHRRPRHRHRPRRPRAGCRRTRSASRFIDGSTCTCGRSTGFWRSSGSASTTSARCIRGRIKIHRVPAAQRAGSS